MNNLLILNSMWKSFHHNSRGRTLKLDLLVTNALQNVLYLIAMLHSYFLETAMSKIYACKDSYFRKQECLKNVKKSNTWEQTSHKILWPGSVCVCVCARTCIHAHTSAHFWSWFECVYFLSSYFMLSMYSAKVSCC